MRASSRISNSSLCERDICFRRVQAARHHQISIRRHKYSKWRTVRREQLKNQNGLRTIVNGTQILGESTVVKKLTKKWDTKLYDIEVTEVDKADKRLKIYYM